MNRIAIIIATAAVLVAAIAAITVITLTNHDASVTMGFLAATVIPTITSLFAFSEASKARENTNGLLHSQIARADTAEAKVAELSGK